MKASSATCLTLKREWWVKVYRLVIRQLSISSIAINQSLITPHITLTNLPPIIIGSLVSAFKYGGHPLDETNQVGNLDLFIALLFGQFSRVNGELIELFLPVYSCACLLELLDETQWSKCDEIRFVALKQLAASLLLVLFYAIIIGPPVIAEFDLRVLTVDGGLPPSALALELCAFLVEVHPPTFRHKDYIKYSTPITKSDHQLYLPSYAQCQ